MSHTPWFFVTLGLAPSADQQAIRRAYAAALKRLDQQLQAEEFQQLRQAYELARQWRETEELQEDSLPIEQPIAPEPRPAPSKVRPIEISAAEANSQAEPAISSRVPQSALIDLSRLEEEQQAVLAEWTQRLCQPELQEAQALLDQALADPRLGLDVREDLERRLLAFLRQSDTANQPLFEAAANAFAWRSHSLQIEDSAWIEAYLLEEDQWLVQDKAARTAQLAAIQGLRNAGKYPHHTVINQHWPLLAEVLENYPQWLHLRLGKALCQDCQVVYAELQVTLQQWAEQLCQPNLQNASHLLNAALAQLPKSVLGQLEKRLLAFLLQSSEINWSLFEAAACCFDWRSNTSRLDSPWVEACLREEAQWSAQSEETKAHQLAAIQALIQQDNPSRFFIKRYWKLLIDAQINYPNWLHLQLGHEACKNYLAVYASPMSHIALFYHYLYFAASLIYPPFLLMWFQHNRSAKTTSGFIDKLVFKLISISTILSFITLIIIIASDLKDQMPEKVVIDLKTCTERYQLAHSSDWQDIEQEILACVEQNLWPDKQDPLLADIRRNQEAQETYKRYRRALNRSTD